MIHPSSKVARMKRRDLEQHLRQHGCDFHHAGREHDVWMNLTTFVQDAIPRHREIKPGLVRAICKQLGVPIPRGK